MKVTAIDESLFHEAANKRLFQTARALVIDEKNPLALVLGALKDLGVEPASVGRIVGVHIHIPAAWISRRISVPRKHEEALLAILNSAVQAADLVVSKAEGTGLYPQIALDEFNGKIYRAQDLLDSFDYREKPLKKRNGKRRN